MANGFCPEQGGRSVHNLCALAKSIIFTTSLKGLPKQVPMEEEFIRSGDEIRRLIYERKERLKELACINASTQVIRENKRMDETLQQIVLLLPPAWQYPEHTVARIVFNGKEFCSARFSETQWGFGQNFETIGNKKGRIEVFYLKRFREEDEGPFLKEERQLLDNLSSIIANYLNSIEAREILRQSLGKENIQSEISEFQTPAISSRQLLQKFLNKQNANRDIFHDLMPYKVREILLVATLYDAFSIEKEGRFSEHILGEYHQLNLTSMPRVTGVSTYEEAIELLRNRHFDIVILMIGGDKRSPVELSRKVKQEFPYIPIYVLLNNNRDVPAFKNIYKGLATIDKLFVWNGDSKVFFAMVKLLEDKVNAENDTQVGLVQVILLVEDSEQYYSRYLPLLYHSVLEQTQRIIEEVSTDELFKVLRLRARPKILLASDYEEAISVIEKHRDNLLCLITDVKFEKDGQLMNEAGFSLVEYVRQVVNDLPVIIQSSDVENEKMAYNLKAAFINKNSESLLQDIKGFISHHLGFGNFVYRDASGKKIAVAQSLKEFERLIDTIPAESLVYHGRRNHFSMWLMARGEIKIAKMIHPVKVTDFSSSDEFRNYLKYVIKKYRNESQTGKVINFEESAITDESNIVSLGTGGLGGKGRGLAFINTLVYNVNFNEIVPNINIRTPRTLIIGTDEFDQFLERNNLYEAIHSGLEYDKLKVLFLKSELSFNLDKKLRVVLKYLDRPLAVRSSSLFEDSGSQPFSGIFETYLLPNNHPDFNVRYTQLENAIKLVYASIYSDHSRTYFKAIDFKVEEEKMAVILQEVVGNQFGHYFYPHISGIAQSHNYYPVAHMEPEDGFAVAALGLGHYVVQGEKAYRFSPRYPEVEVIPPKTLLNDSQTQYYAIDLEKKELSLLREGEYAGLTRLELRDAEMQGTLTHLASVYDHANERLEPGIDGNGPRVINFANILKFNHVPLAKSIEVCLDVMKEAMGSPVEIEFAVDLKPSYNGNPTFYLLQIKPLIETHQDFNIDIDHITLNHIILRAEHSMGNGLIGEIEDVIYVDKSRFDRMKTRQMADEIEKLNAMMMAQNRKYILIGPGRWGTRDRFIGIPVAWPQICNARVIVEISMEGFPLDASLGSHFFHNVTSMNVGYFSVQHTSQTDFIRWELLDQMTPVNEASYFRHVRFEKPLTVLMDGKKRIAMIISNHYEY